MECGNDNGSSLIFNVPAERTCACILAGCVDVRHTDGMSRETVDKEDRPLVLPPRPAPSSPPAENEGPGLQRLDPANTESAALHRTADKLIEVALSRSAPAASPSDRKLARPAFDEAKATRAAARVAEIQEQQRAASLRYARGVTERDGGRGR